MRIQNFRLVGIRCFEDTGYISLSPGCNIFIGENNSGKTTILRSITDWQITPRFDSRDARPEFDSCFNTATFENLTEYERRQLGNNDTYQARYTISGTHDVMGYNWSMNQSSQTLFSGHWPRNSIIPFLAKRKAVAFGEQMDLAFQSNISGTFSNLYAKIDRVSNPGTAAHEKYKKSVESILGLFITTVASSGGKQAGYYYNDDEFVTLDRMGDGVSEVVALLVELSLAKNKVFVLEEPETNLHPRGLKALLDLIRESSKFNQFIIATHSNIVLRELAVNETKIFRVYRDEENPSRPSQVAEVPNLPQARMELLRELGYEFVDFELHEAWLFLEESSAETIISQILIPWFLPRLSGKLRTFSAGGVTNVDPAVSEFQRLVTFVHLQSVYQRNIWVRTDGDSPGQNAAQALREKFSYLDEIHCNFFQEHQFENYYPRRFEQKIKEALATNGKQEKRRIKLELLNFVLDWSLANPEEAKVEWEESAFEIIDFLKAIQKQLVSVSRPSSRNQP